MRDYHWTHSPDVVIEAQRRLGDSPKVITKYIGEPYLACDPSTLKIDSNSLVLQMWKLRPRGEGESREGEMPEVAEGGVQGTYEPRWELLFLWRSER